MIARGGRDMNIERICNQNRKSVNDFIMEYWYTTKMILRGEEIDMTAVEGIVISENGEIIGLLTYIVYDDTLEITSLDSLRENQGIGTMLLERVTSIAKEAGCKKIVVVTTNDNIKAIRFYQRRGYDMAHLYRNALEVSRKLKPEIPLIGENGIPLRHEIEFEMILNL